MSRSLVKWVLPVCIALACVVVSADRALARDGRAGYRKTGRLSVATGEVVDGQTLLVRMADAFGLNLAVAPGAVGVEIRFVTGGDLDFETVRGVLKVHGVALVHQPGPDGLSWAAMTEREVQDQFGGTPTPVTAPGEDLPDGATLVTAVIPLHHADPNAVFATLRQLVSRSFGKVGQIFYVRGPEAIIIRDFAENVDYFQRIIAQLDVPSEVAPAEVQVVSLEHMSATAAVEAAKAVVSNDPRSPGAIFFGVSMLPLGPSRQVVVSGTPGAVASTANLLRELDARYRRPVLGIAVRAYQVSTARWQQAVAGHPEVDGIQDRLRDMADADDGSAVRMVLARGFVLMPGQTGSAQSKDSFVLAPVEDGRRPRLDGSVALELRPEFLGAGRYSLELESFVVVTRAFEGEPPYERFERALSTPVTVRAGEWRMVGEIGSRGGRETNVVWFVRVQELEEE